MNVRSMLKLTISMAIFGSIGFFTTQTGLPAVELVFVRCICATIFLGGLWLITGGHKTEDWNRSEVMKTIVCGIFLVLNWVFLFKAFEVMSISIAISIYNLAPIFVLILGSVFLAEKMGIRSICATAICFFGSILIIGIESFTSVSQFMNSGFIWALLSAICYALTMFTSKTIHGMSSYALTYIQTITGIILLLPFCDFAAFEGLTNTNWLYILGTGLIHTGFVYYLFFDSVRDLPTVIVSVLVFVDPVVAILLDALLLSFRPGLLQVLGIVLIFGSILYTVFYPQQTVNKVKQVVHNKIQN
ncbi:drug/metabolite transporter (DMT)-like permease [Solibacillus kalamii]|uniref:EamA family transporter n=1 Tax=Solibacillus kalamii TaxID=1748298 RepID=A0ABX3ZEQ1_9BACL|nr:DMT family transporter [Solibacillus kalamii]MBM7667053.1 drug/metabolite transporter (DMT)-like permease [Solibacillus kalamii]OUZ38199.1 EamA family transporter [Solibacillus kalamii]